MPFQEWVKVEFWVAGGLVAKAVLKSVAESGITLISMSLLNFDETGLPGEWSD